MASYADPSSVERVEQVEWVESGGGPLIAIPEVVLPFWTGADGDELASDYDRACEVDGLVGLLPVGNTTALVLGDEPAATSYLPEHGTFVRWSAGDSERELLAGVAGRPRRSGVGARGALGGSRDRRAVRRGVAGRGFHEVGASADRPRTGPVRGARGARRTGPGDLDRTRAAEASGAVSPGTENGMRAA